jgi:hypothetical protein
MEILAMPIMLFVFSAVIVGAMFLEPWWEK